MKRLTALLLALFAFAISHEAQAEALHRPQAAEARKLFGRRKPQRWNDKMPGILARFDPQNTLAGTEGSPLVVALTLDACGPRPGHSSYDARIIKYLKENGIPATIFVTNSWLRANTKALEELAANPLFEIAAHGARHRPCSVNGRSAFGIKGTANLEELLDEVEGNAAAITDATGKRPRWFRAGTAYYDDVAVEIIHWLGMGIAGYNVAADAGATLEAGEVARNISRAKTGSVILCHLNHPESGTFQGIKAGVDSLLKKKARFVRLSDIYDALWPGYGSIQPEVGLSDMPPGMSPSMWRFQPK